MEEAFVNDKVPSQIRNYDPNLRSEQELTINYSGLD
jgi:hypothetical protein